MGKVRMRALSFSHCLSSLFYFNTMTSCISCSLQASLKSRVFSCYIGPNVMPAITSTFPYTSLLHCLRPVFLSRAQELLYYSSAQISQHVSVFWSFLWHIWLSSLLYTALPSVASAVNSYRLASPWKYKETVESTKLCNPELDALHPVS